MRSSFPDLLPAYIEEEAATVSSSLSGEVWRALGTQLARCAVQRNEDIERLRRDRETELNLWHQRAAQEVAYLQEIQTALD